MTKKIKKIQIRNFQSHEDLTLEIAPMLTTIVGASDAGKSAVIRAVRWALFNEPAGTQFMRIGTRDTFVLVEFTDGSSVLRARDKSENYYVLKDPAGETLRLEGFGQSVPEEVARFTGIRKVQIGEKDSLAVNIAGQLEGPFLLGEKSSVRAEAIGKLAGTDRIDAAHRATSADKFNNQRRIGQLKLDMQNLEEELASFAYLSDLEKKIERLETLTQRITACESRLEPLRKLQFRLKSNADALAFTRQRVDTYAGLARAVRLHDEVSRVSARTRRYERWQQRMEGNRSAAEKTRQDLHAQSRFLGFVQEHRVLSSAEHWLRLRRLKEGYTAWFGADQAARKHADRPVKEASALLDRLDTANRRVLALQAVRQQYADRQARLQKGMAYLQARHQVTEAAEKVGQGHRLTDRIVHLRSLKNRLETVQRLLAEQKTVCRTATETARQLMDTYIQSLGQSRQCPYCFQALDDQSLTHLRHHLEGEPNEL